jgi:hypothetical protein
MWQIAFMIFSLLVAVMCKVNEPVLGFESVKILDNGQELIAEFTTGSAVYSLPVSHQELRDGKIYLGSENEKDIELIRLKNNETVEWVIRFGDQSSDPEYFKCSL